MTDTPRPRPLTIILTDENGHDTERIVLQPPGGPTDDSNDELETDSDE